MKKICYIGAAIAAVGIIIILLVGLLNPGGYNNSGVDASNFKISELTSEQIVNTEGECKAFMTSFKRSGSRSGISSQYFDDEDGDKTVYSAKKITGIKNVSATLAKDCTLVLNIDKGKHHIIANEESNIIMREANNIIDCEAIHIIKHTGSLPVTKTAKYLFYSPFTRKTPPMGGVFCRGGPVRR